MAAQKTCAHCGNPQQGSANIGPVPVCHPDNPDLPDCYRLITVFHEPLGIRRPDAGPLRTLAHTYIFVGEEYPLIQVVTMFEPSIYHVHPWKTVVIALADENATACRTQTYNAALAGHKDILADVVEHLKSRGLPPLAVTDTPPIDRETTRNDDSL